MAQPGRRGDRAVAHRRPRCRRGDRARPAPHDLRGRRRHGSAALQHGDRQADRAQQRADEGWRLPARAGRAAGADDRPVGAARRRGAVAQAGPHRVRRPRAVPHRRSGDAGCRHGRVPGADQRQGARPDHGRRRPRPRRCRSGCDGRCEGDHRIGRSDPEEGHRHPRPHGQHRRLTRSADPASARSARQVLALARTNAADRLRRFWAHPERDVRFRVCPERPGPSEFSGGSEDPLRFAADHRSMAHEPAPRRRRPHPARRARRLVGAASLAGFAAVGGAIAAGAATSAGSASAESVAAAAATTATTPAATTVTSALAATAATTESTTESTTAATTANTATTATTAAGTDSSSHGS